MTTPQVIALGILQGITEFVPISSDGHLVVAEAFLGLAVDQTKSFDIVLHMGTLLAMLVYFWKDLWNTKYWKWMVWGTLPAVVFGLLAEDAVDSLFRNAFATGLLLFATGLLYTFPEPKKQEAKLNFKNVFWIGMAQALAILPGVSRSGSTIWTATRLGIAREEAARFSFVLGSVAITGAGVLTALKWEPTDIPSSMLVTGFVTSFVAGLAAVHFLIQFLKKHSLKVFGMYMMVLGLTVAILSPMSIRSETAQREIVKNTLAEPSQAILVFGAGLKTDGTPSDVLNDRLKVAADLYELGKAPDIIVSGDNRFEDYNEPEAMRTALVQMGVPSTAIHLDFAGRRTYDTCTRAHQIWGVNSAILVTQAFHMPRALYTCEQIGIQSQGATSDLQQYVDARTFAWREWLATYKAFIDLHLWHPRVILGEPESLN